MRTIAIITWGNNAEREVSLRSAASVEQALQELSYKVMKYDFPTQQEKFLQEKDAIEFCWIMIHGKGGEDGEIAKFLDELQIPYQWARAEVQAICLDKSRSKEIWTQAWLPVPRAVTINFQNTDRSEFSQQANAIWLPCVVKAVDEWSTRWLVLCFSKQDLLRAYTELQHYPRVLIEEYISGDEFTVGLLDLPDGTTTALPVVQIIPPVGERFDYENKYNGKTTEICPAQINATLTEELQQLALKAYRAVGCTGYARVDIIVGASWAKLIEINNIPGFTDQSLYPKQAAVGGYAFPTLLKILMKETK